MEWVVFTYTYDEHGNMTTVREDATTVFNKTYNSQNQISGFTYDSRGNLTADGNFQYVWDNQNRLQELKSATGDPIETYLYNERGLRLKAIGGEAPFSIFAFDGKLLAQFQYSPGGLQIREYLYLGDRLIAEYRQSGNKLYSYTPDQINSVRMITDNTGLVVHSTAYDPYGGIEKTWVGYYSPILKFSGKERDSESRMDYFGARYYAGIQYRFISPDPLIDKTSSIFDPQTWNLYSYARNNPITVYDPTGKKLIPVNLPGIGKTYLDDRFYSDLQKLISRAQEAGIELTFTEAFRTAEDQKRLYEKDPKRAVEPGHSPHEAGFAVDIVWSQLTESERKFVAGIAQELGLSTGKKFSEQSEPGHLYKEVPWGKENRPDYIKLIQTY